MQENLTPRLEIALKRGGPALHEIIRTLDAQGFSQLEILDAFYRLWDKLREEDRETEEDTVSNEIDMIVGWCSPHLRHEFARPYTKEEYDRYMKQRANRWKGKISL